MPVNRLMGSPGFDMVLSVIGVLLFAGLTTFDAQRLKRLYSHSADDEGGPLTVLRALPLYLDFLNLFLFLPHFKGQRRA